MTSTRFCSRVALLGMTVLSGCYSGEDEWTRGRPKVYQTQGIVKMSGKPLVNAIVIFNPVDGEYGGTATTDEDGRYQLTTFKDRDGVIEGNFQVSIEKNDWIPIGPPGGQNKDGGVYLPPLKKVPLVDAKFSNFEESGMMATVSPDGENEFDFEVEPASK